MGRCAALVARLVTAVLLLAPPWCGPAMAAGMLAPSGTLAQSDTDASGACVWFNAPLAENRGDLSAFVALEPAADVAVTANDRQLCLSGLEPGKAYSVTVRAGLPAADGAVLPKNLTFRLVMHDLPGSVRIAGTGYVLPRVGNAGVGVETVNIPRVTLSLYRAPETALANLSLNQDPTGWSVESLVNEKVRPVWTGTMDTKGQQNKRSITNFPLDQVLKDRQPGAYLLVVEDEKLAKDKDDLPYQEREARTAARWLVETDMALTALTGGDGLTVVARSLAKATPLSGARVVLVAHDSGTLGEAKTDGDGIAHFPIGLLRGKGGARPALVEAFAGGPSLIPFASSPADFAALSLDRAAFDFSARGADGRPDPGPLDAYVYTERGIYRPGEVVHAAFMLRDAQIRTSAVDTVALVVRRSDGVEAAHLTAKLASGAGTVDLPISAAAPRGEWTIDIYVAGGDAVVGSGSFQVEDFVPERLKVTIGKAPAPSLTAGQAATLPVEARFLYGAAAGDLPVGGEVRLERDDKPFAKWTDFAFGRDDDKFEPQTASAVDTHTDGEGKAQVQFPVPEAGTATAPLRAVVTVAVVEPGGRVTRDQTALPVNYRAGFVGVRPLFANHRVREGGNADFDILAVDGQGTPQAVKGLRYTVSRVDRHYTWYRSGYQWSYKSSAQYQTVASGTLDLDAGKPARLSQRLEWGEYRLLVENPATGAVTTVPFYSGWYMAGASTDAPDVVPSALDKAAYRAGETAHLRIEPPFAGQMQVAVAGQEVHILTTRAVGAEPVTVDIPVKAEWGAGAYALVSFVRPADKVVGHQPVRAVGLAWIPVDSAPKALTVSINAPKTLRPRQKVDVQVDAAGAGAGAYVTVAAVDEGILQLTRFRSPDPLAHYFAKRKLAAEMRDDYGRLLESQAGATGVLRQGGDGSPGGAGLPVVPTRTVALFSGLVPLDGKGHGKVTLDIPDFNGSLRLMAVALDKDRMGMAEGAMVVRDPVVAEVILPRFLAPNDTAAGTLLLHNLEGAAGDYRVTLVADGALKLVGDARRTVTLAASQRVVQPVALRGGEAGIGGLTLQVEGPGGLKLERSWPITVRPAEAPIVMAEQRQQAPGEAFTLPPNLLDIFLPGTGSITLSYANLPGIDVAGLMKDLDLYPYGCTEQTTSRALPLVAFRDLARQLGLEGSVKDPDNRVNTAIDRLLQRQDTTGQFGLWAAGDGLGATWLQMYVFDFLSRARAAGYAVPDTAMQSLADWVTQQTDRGVGATGGEGEALVYGQYLLARGGHANPANLRYIHDVTGEQLSAGPLAYAQLGAALLASGDKARADVAFERARRHLGQASHDYYSSPLRDAAATLAVAAEANNTALQETALRLALSGLKEPWYYNTNQKSWLLLAAQAILAKGQPITLTTTGYAKAATGRALTYSPTPAQMAAGFGVVNSGAAPVWRTVQLRGVPKESPGPVSQGITLTKEVYTLDGQPAGTDHVARNTRLVVVLTGTLQQPVKRTLVTVDPLPAGWEIESVLRPARKGKKALDWLKNLSRAAVAEARDDRFVGVLDAGQSSWIYRDEDDEDESEGVEEDSGPTQGFRFAYIVRAVTPGQFALPPASTQDMYDPGAIARTAAGHTVVDAGP
ncbi:alpha-2-macroglobulin [Nitrospirillum sp. BR 11828]|uniref:alpha-2-macroglobulin family protein n=1 Tax=Nitrospirillum sp. BR 11828 TaxID=3104325 RepID=UPI002ACA514F|nr:alpha-2-macroglobulin [Nitrospirillum sp. BR 11828]MDZ5648292.1 alpha-2-macroglobulin [Nitrospirillum sp. BR 11828]